MIVDTAKGLRIIEGDLARSVFVAYPYEREIVYEDKDNWLATLKQKIEGGTYEAGNCDIAEVPKGKGAVRPGSILTIEDMVAYSSIVDRTFSKIHSELIWSQGVKDFAYNLVESPDDDQWFKGAYGGWEKFREESLRLMANGTAYVVVTDITGFYENIDHETLASDLRQIGVDNATIGQLKDLLSGWSEIGTKGIPQAISASHLLAKLYLNPVDRTLHDLGFTHTRYSDDFRIFCKSYVEAKQVLVVLSGLLRQRGLNLQSAKSRIERVDSVKPEVEGAIAIIEDIVQELETLDGAFDASGLFEMPDTPSPNTNQLEAAKRAFDNYFRFGEGDKFNKSLFHYLLNQLGAAADDYAVEYCIAQLEKHPEEMKEILRYFARLARKEDVITSLVDFMDSDVAIYDYQNYQIIEWLNKVDAPSGALLDICRRYAFDNNKPSYFRSICKKTLGAYGSATDLGRILRSYTSATTLLEECSTVCCLKRLERSRRNAFIERVKNKSLYHGIAGELAKRTS